eukprot:CAMPEP_0113849518 /NCGR_PEP_ID=MMETSP0372-20130328/3195_1 /TAXON_ID=340204 /ORGANISM="Lankesteria abbotti" /LENGTH=163 /DNA_ID=CAMNT_0000819357 /DNA_START=61 /DNA_END=552 /DNA_ORIENTATION=+ /assembly_acc=CAM_ASM_000359
MSDVEDHQFEGAEAGASHTIPMQAGAVKKGGHVMLKGKPCKVVDYSTSKTGKHGHAKAHIVGLDIFSGKKLEDICPTSHNMQVPVVKRTEYQLIDVDKDGFVSLLTESGEMKADLQLPKDGDGNLEDVAKAIVAGFDEGKTLVVTVLGACGQEKVVSTKEVQS